MNDLQHDPAEDLIMTWYYWARSCREFLGYPKMSPIFTSAKPGITHEEDVAREEREERIARQQAEQVDVCIDELPTWQMRSAVTLHAANKAARVKVYRNPRMSAEQMHHTYQEAKALLAAKFIKRGLMVAESV